MTGILLVTHGQVGDALLDSAKSILGNITAPIATLSVKRTKKTQRMHYRQGSLAAEKSR